jgi:hypothetical protein
MTLLRLNQVWLPSILVYIFFFSKMLITGINYWIIYLPSSRLTSMKSTTVFMDFHSSTCWWWHYFGYSSESFRIRCSVPCMGGLAFVSLTSHLTLCVKWLRQLCTMPANSSNWMNWWIHFLKQTKLFLPDLTGCSLTFLMVRTVLRWPNRAESVP